MVVHKFEIINGRWSHTGTNAVCSRSLRDEIDNNPLLQGFGVKSTVEDNTLTMTYSDNHLVSPTSRHEIQLLTAKLAHIYVITHAEVKRKGANIIRFRYTFERTA